MGTKYRSTSPTHQRGELILSSIDLCSSEWRIHLIISEVLPLLLKLFKFAFDTWRGQVNSLAIGSFRLDWFMFWQQELPSTGLTNLPGVVLLVLWLVVVVGISLLFLVVSHYNAGLTLTNPSAVTHIHTYNPYTYTLNTSCPLLVLKNTAIQLLEKRVPLTLLIVMLDRFQLIDILGIFS